MPKKRFLRQEWWKYKRLRRELKWRKPRGAKNPIRRRIRGRQPMPRIGYRRPKVVRGLHPTGLEEVLVYNVKDLEALNPQQHIARIGGSVGKRKRAEIIKRAKELGIKVVQSA